MKNAILALPLLLLLAACATSTTSSQTQSKTQEVAILKAAIVCIEEKTHFKLAEYPAWNDDKDAYIKSLHAWSVGAVNTVNKKDALTKAARECMAIAKKGGAIN